MQKFRKEFSAASLFVWSTISVVLQVKGVYEMIPYVSEGIVVATLLTVMGMSLFYLIMSAIDNTVAVIKRLKANNIIEPDTGVYEAIKYIVSDSKYGSALQYDRNGFASAGQALKKAILDRNIRVFGVTKENAIPHEYILSEGTELKFTIEDLGQSLGRGYRVNLYVKEGEVEVLKNILFCKAQLKKTFKPKF